jgi:hypothetical protein
MLHFEPSAILHSATTAKWQKFPHEISAELSRCLDLQPQTLRVSSLWVVHLFLGYLVPS